MATQVLQQFRRRFLSAAVQEKMNISLARNDEPEYLSGLEQIKPDNRVLVFGHSDIEIVQSIARKVGPGGMVLILDDSPSRVFRLREHLNVLPEAASVSVFCAEFTNLRTDLEWAEQLLHEEPVASLAHFLEFKRRVSLKAEQSPLIADASLDAILSTHLLNRSFLQEVVSALGEAHRVLRKGGQAIFNYLVSDEQLTQGDLESLSSSYDWLKSVPREEESLSLLEQAGFYGLEITRWDEFPQYLINSVEIRGITVRGFKGKEGPCYDCNHAVIYRGPWKRVHDDDGHVYRRGERVAVCEKTYRILTGEPYRDHFIPVPPYIEVPVDTAPPFGCQGVTKRDPGVTKGVINPSQQTDSSSSACGC